MNEGNASHPTNDALAPFQAQMERLGLWPRITVQWMVKDPRGKTAGCFAGHRQAWAAALAEGCHNMMAMEEDLVYAEDEIEVRGAGAGPTRRPHARQEPHACGAWCLH